MEEPEEAVTKDTIEEEVLLEEEEEKVIEENSYRESNESSSFFHDTPFVCRHASCRAAISDAVPCDGRKDKKGDHSCVARASQCTGR